MVPDLKHNSGKEYLECNKYNIFFPYYGQKDIASQ